MEPVVSILMGVHRAKDFDCLRHSVQSILDQKYQKWELIIIDDGSRSPELSDVLRELSLLDDRIIVLDYKDNRGLAYALNYGLARARGRYIARQDDDDCSNSDRLSIQVKCLDANPDISIVGTNATLYDKDGTWGALKMPAFPTSNDFLWNSPFIHPSVMMRRNDLQSVGGYRVAKETIRCEDYDLFMRMYAAGFKGMNLQKKMYLYQSDRQLSKYRPMKRRIEESIVRAKGFKRLHLGLRAFPYVVKPLLLGLLPEFIYGYIQNRRNAEDAGI